MPEDSRQRPKRQTCAVLLNVKTGREYVLGETTILGRMRKCDVTLTASKVSRYHARIIRSGELYLLDDLESRNGTYLDNRRVREATPLRDGSRILIGDASLVFFERTAPQSGGRLAAVIDDKSRPTIIRSLKVDDCDYLAEAASAAGREDSGSARTRLTLFRSVIERLRFHRGVDALLEELTKQFLHVFPWVEHCVVALRESAGKGFLIKTEQRRDPNDADALRISRAGLDRAMTSGCALLTEEERWSATAARADDSSQALAFRVGMCIPLLVPERAVGVVHMGASSISGRFDEADLGMATAIAKEAAILIDALQIYERTRRERDRLQEENARLRDKIRQAYHFDKVIGQSKAIQQAIADAQRVSKLNTNVLLQGEKGTGKRLFAELIHHNSVRSSERIAIVNCSSVSPTALEGLLFGPERSPSGSTKHRPGYIELADRGTLLLDEIGDLPDSVQARVVRALEDSKVIRLVEPEPITAVVRVIATTEKDLPREIEEGRFRKDLYNHLHFTLIELPPLRKRADDVVALANHFHALFCAEMNKRAGCFSPAAIEALQQYGWPGNVRELRNTVERLVMTASPGMAIDEADVQRMVGASPVH